MPAIINYKIRARLRLLLFTYHLHTIKTERKCHK